MKFLKPYKNFGEANVTQSYHEKHRAIDSLPSRKKLLGYGTPLVAPEDCTIGKVYGNNYTPGDDGPLKNGFGLWMKGVSGYEHLYWHTQPILPVSTGDFVKKGTIVAFCGNSGNVYSDGEYVPLDKRDVPNFAGTHLHHQVVKDGVLLNPMEWVDLVLEPNYGMLDELEAIGVTLLKISKLI